jgi:transposase
VATTFQIKYSTVCAIYNRFLRTGLINNAPRGGYKPRTLTPENRAVIQGWLDEDCQLKLKDLKRKLEDELEVVASVETVRRAVDDFNYSIKLVRATGAAADTEERWQQRVVYSQWFVNSPWNQERVVFVDENVFNLSVRRSRGWARRGSTPRIIVPSLRTRNISVMAAIGFDGLIHYRVLDGNGNRERFLDFLTDLYPVLQPDTVLVMDNSSIHKGPVMHAHVHEAGFTVRYLPAYSPYFNPIENFLQQWKTVVRNQGARTEPELMAAIHTLRDHVTPQQCHNCFDHVNNNCIACITGERDLH